MPSLLIVEDDTSLSQGIVLSLRQEDYKFTQCYNLREARTCFEQESYDLILLDVGLPDGNGLDFCREIRKKSKIPVLFLTANDAEYDEVAGLEAGADDYITKPFRLAVLRARVSAALRRAQTKIEEIYQNGALQFDFEKMLFWKAEKELVLSKTEQKLLRMLVKNEGATVTRDTLLDNIWDGGEFVDENTLSVAIRRLRGKIETDPKNPEYIHTVYGIGYTWKKETNSHMGL